ncbi:hypothetical protein A2810_00625 [candidate division Kazan bacterium RIFCSPHIGHO2_01_FULL_49_10]|uniref:Non-canonical purine NTP pyrophosphatase n=1 Tax=candidate division Kazan bacterium RIFCSPLOWO2_01_FULL_48_13 TaxID=1798539 RepID=A0A1F4PMR7_UNCK3|nr:MAG: hypothetical protein A2810_00625 [candidate division Kazan bacterium RIFCSPHIGHO2_01_FULL_49_10]OGB85133.1 MAG: hypothetical protein A2994_03840 [candidate division Kazan bacterium RIFCSPLOWO2_01_FULL_48_13]
MKILFVTGNGGKVATLRHYLEQLGIEIEQRELPLIEPQQDSVEDVAKDSGNSAFAKLSDWLGKNILTKV